MAYIPIPTVVIVGFIVFMLWLITQVYRSWAKLRAKNAVWIEKNSHKRSCGEVLSFFKTDRMAVLFNEVRRDGTQFYLMQNESVMACLTIERANIDATERYFAKYGYQVNKI